jgi:hypothetical protein
MSRQDPPSPVRQAGTARPGGGRGSYADSDAILLARDAEKDYPSLGAEEKGASGRARPQQQQQPMASAYGEQKQDEARLFADPEAGEVLRVGGGGAGAAAGYPDQDVIPPGVDPNFLRPERVRRGLSQRRESFLLQL